MNEHEYLQEYDKRYLRMRNLLITLLSIMGFLFSTLIVVGIPQIATISSTKKQVEINCEDINYVKDNSVSQRAIDNLIMTFENQTRVMEEYLPDDVQGAMIEFRKVSSDLRAWIIMYNSDLNPRGGDK